MILYLTWFDRNNSFDEVTMERWSQFELNISTCNPFDSSLIIPITTLVKISVNEVMFMLIPVATRIIVATI